MEQRHKYVLAPRYSNDCCHYIGVLQQLQTLLSDQATLDDVIQLIQSFQREFGAQKPLECVIQSLVGRDLEAQMHRKHASLLMNARVG